MNAPMKDLLVVAMQKPDPKPFVFEIGQTVRVRKGLWKDGQTPRFWDGALVTVVRRESTLLLKVHYYTLRHENGAEDDFEECEIDWRYRRKISREPTVVIPEMERR